MATSLTGIKKGLDNLMEEKSIQNGWMKLLSPESLCSSCWKSGARMGEGYCLRALLLWLPRESSWPLCDTGCRITWISLGVIQQGSSDILIN